MTPPRDDQAVLQTLGERLPAGKARDLAEQPPAEVGAWLAAERHSQRMDVEELVRRVAEREQSDVGTATRIVCAPARALSGRA